MLETSAASRCRIMKRGREAGRDRERETGEREPRDVFKEIQRFAPIMKRPWVQRMVMVRLRAVERRDVGG